MINKSKNENGSGMRDVESRDSMKTKQDIKSSERDKQIQHKTNLGLGMGNTPHDLCNILCTPSGEFSTCICTAPSMLQSLSRTEKLTLEILTLVEWPIWIFGPCVSPAVGPSILTPVYMMEHVKPQHSFSRVRPVLAKGEDVCWALDGARLVGTPEAQRNHTVRKRWHIVVVYCIMCITSST